MMLMNGGIKIVLEIGGIRYVTREVDCGRLWAAEDAGSEVITIGNHESASFVGNQDPLVRGDPDEGASYIVSRMRLI